MNVVIFIAYTGSQFTNSPGTFFRSAAQIPLHKMYTFVYRTFIKFMFFCRGQALDASSTPSKTYLPGTGTGCFQYPFKNLGFMRFPEPVFAGIYQNILTAAVFRAC